MLVRTIINSHHQEPVLVSKPATLLIPIDSSLFLVMVFRVPAAGLEGAGWEVQAEQTWRLWDQAVLEVAA